jgi:nucleoside-diphosphate-sugar epimerase
MGELTLRAYAAEYGMKTASCRYFTVYGPRAKENHAVMAMIARAFIGQDPFEVWGTGEQIRNWTYVDDIVSGTILAAETIEDGTAVNLGTTERIRVRDAVQLILHLMGREARIVTRPDMPTGPLNRVASNELAGRLLGWRPGYTFRQGVERTIEWYRATKRADDVQRVLEGGGLIERRARSFDLDSNELMTASEGASLKLDGAVTGSAANGDFTPIDTQAHRNAR